MEKLKQIQANIDEAGPFEVLIQIEKKAHIDLQQALHLLSIFLEWKIEALVAYKWW